MSVKSMKMIILWCPRTRLAGVCSMQGPFTVGFAVYDIMRVFENETMIMAKSLYFRISKYTVQVQWIFYVLWTKI